MKRLLFAKLMSLAGLLPLCQLAVAVAPDGEGTAEIAFVQTSGAVVSGTDITVPADARGTWVLTFTAGPHGIATGGGFEVKRRGEWDFRLGTVKQLENPQGEDYVTVQCSVPDATVEISHIGRYFKDMHEATVRLTHGALKEGDRITLVVGDRSQGGPGTVVVPHAHDDRPLRIASDGDGNGQFVPLSPYLHVTVAAEAAVRLEVVAPSTVVAGETFDLLIRAEDHNSNLDRTFNETLSVECSDPKAIFPAEVSLSRDDGGIKRVPCRFISPGFHRFKVSCVPRNRPSTGVMMLPLPLIGLSNPTQIHNTAPEYRLYWGDLHVHTFESDGTDTLDENYIYAREVAALDFCAVTDHLRPGQQEGSPGGMLQWRIENGFHPPVTLKEWWDGMMDAADGHNQPGKFVTFYGYEWSGGPSVGGDHNLILADRHPLINHEDLNELYASLRMIDRGDNVLINPHVGGRIGNWDWHDLQVEPVLEICSVHGHFEWFAQEALQRGYKVGFIGGGDNHHGRPGNAIWQRFGRMGFRNAKEGVPKRAYTVPGGFAGVYATELTRKSILSAIRARRCFATTSRRILLEFTSDGHSMGQEYSAEESPKLYWRVVGTAPLERVDLIRNQQRIHTQPAGRRLLLEGGLRDARCPPGDNYYYLRVTQEDGEIAWSSPIFFHLPGKSETHAGPSEPAWNFDGSREQILAQVPVPPGPDYSPEALRHLEIRAPGRFVELVQERVVASVRGRYVVLLGYDKNSDMAPVRIRYYPDFTEPRFSIYPGWGDYGPIRQ